jgi:hypothetical protein
LTAHNAGLALALFAEGDVVADVIVIGNCCCCCCFCRGGATEVVRAFIPLSLSLLLRWGRSGGMGSPTTALVRTLDWTRGDAAALPKYVNLPPSPAPAAS